MHLLRLPAAACATLSLLLLTACGGSGTSNPSQTGGAADFSLTAAPPTVMMSAGSTGQTVNVSVTPTNGFSGSVSVALSGLPTGVTATPATLSVLPGTPQTVSLMAASSATAGTYTISLTGTSGTLSHTATVTATVIPPPDFTFSVSPSAATVIAGGSSAQVSVRADGVNGFANNVAVSITGLPAGVVASPASLMLTPGTTQSVTLTASAAAIAGNATVTFTGTSGTLSHGGTTALTVQLPAAAIVPDVTTFHYNTARDGANTQEKILTPANVNVGNFGQLNFLRVDGKVDAEPLFLANLTVNGAPHNTLFVATEHGSVYAFDADTGAQLWKSSVIPAGQTTSDDHGCGQITAEIGITSTPVIDRTMGPHGTIFVVGMSKETNGTYHHKLHALDVTTGAEASNSPTEIAASYPGTGAGSSGGTIAFQPGLYAERSALLLNNGNLYLGWTSHCDAGAYTGWVMAYNATTLQQTSALNLTPNGQMGSIWMSGNGLSADSSGNMYLLSANGTFDTTLVNGMPQNSNYGNTMLKLHMDAGRLAVADYFAAYNTVQDSGSDTDLGSGGALIFDAADGTGAVHHLMAGAGKNRVLYVADRDNMGKFNPSNVAPDSNLYQRVSGQLGGAVFSSPAYFNGVLYYAASGDSLKALPVTNAKVGAASSHSAATFGYPGSTPAVTANGTANGIVWAVESGTSSPNVLHAYDAGNLANELYNSNQAGSSRDAFGNGNKYITPLVVNGKVYVGTPTGVAVFGLLPK